MRYTDLIFDLYGTLVDIHTEENETVWEKTAMYFGFYGAHYSAGELALEFRNALAKREAEAGQSYECFPDISFEQIMEELFAVKGIVENAKEYGRNAAQLFRIVSIEYINLYPKVPEILAFLREKGFRLWLLSNAQRIFTAYELRYLDLTDKFDGIYISSDYGCRKPDGRFFDALINEQSLDVKKCLMIGNDRYTDIAGAEAAGMATLYMHTNLTPSDQSGAEESRHPYVLENGQNFEYEGWDWLELSKLIETIAMRGEET